MAPISSMPSQMMNVLGGLGVDMGWLLWASSVADCAPLVVLVAACSLICCCLCAILSKTRVSAKEHSLPRRLSVILLSWMRAVLFMSCVFWPFVFLFGGGRGAGLGEGGRHVVRGIVEVVPVWPMGMQTSSTHPQYHRRAQRRRKNYRFSL